MREEWICPDSGNRYTGEWKVDFAVNFDHDDKEMLREKSVYKFTDISDWNVNSFISIYSKI